MGIFVSIVCLVCFSIFSIRIITGSSSGDDSGLQNHRLKSPREFESLTGCGQLSDKNYEPPS